MIPVIPVVLFIMLFVKSFFRQPHLFISSIDRILVMVNMDKKVDQSNDHVISVHHNTAKNFDK